MLEDILQDGPVTVAWWNPNFRHLTNVRHLILKRVVDEQTMRELLLVNPHWRIYAILSHEMTPTAADEERIERGEITREKIYQRQLVRDEDGEPFIDEFGYHVFIRFALGDSADVDLRYDGVTLDPEILKFQS